jgi:hypothetical protein
MTSSFSDKPFEELNVSDIAKRTCARKLWVTAAVMAQMGLEELIAKDEDEYVRIAVNLACNR